MCGGAPPLNLGLIPDCLRIGCCFEEPEWENCVCPYVYPEEGESCCCSCLKEAIGALRSMPGRLRRALGPALFLLDPLIVLLAVLPLLLLVAAGRLLVRGLLIVVVGVPYATFILAKEIVCGLWSCVCDGDPLCW